MTGLHLETPMDPAAVKEVDRIIASELPGVVALRHDLHAHPQVGFQETYASRRVQEALSREGIAFQAGIATTGVVGWIAPDDPARRSAKGVLLRADMDALPMQEETGLPYASTFPGVMHSCGHDGNTAMLVGAAAVLARLREHLPRPVKFLFQPAEEGGAGAEKMLQAGALDSAFGGFDAGMAFALHAKADLPLGTFGACPGPFGARADEIHLSVTGPGGHAARPEKTADPVVAAAAIIMNLQTVVSRNLAARDAAVLTVASIHGGSKDNIIPPAVEMAGTVRAFDDAVAAIVHRRIEEITRQTAALMGCQGQVRIKEGYPVLINDPALTRYACAVAEQAAGAGKVVAIPPSMGAEDFAYFRRRSPVAMLDIGMCPPGRDSYPYVHSPQFDFHDDALPLGIKFLCLAALRSDEALQAV